MSRMPTRSLAPSGAAGAGIVAALGMGPAYCVVVAFYAFAVAFTLKGGRVRAAAVGKPAERAPRADVTSPWRDLKEGMIYVWRTPFLLATMSMALVLNFTAFPLMNSLMPIVAKEVYHTGQTGLSHLAAAGAFDFDTGLRLVAQRGHYMQDACEATSGAMVATGVDDGPPLIERFPIADNATGIHLALGVMAALWQRQSGGFLLEEEDLEAAE